MKTWFLPILALALLFAPVSARSEAAPLEFFIVSEIPVPGGEFINTPKLRRLGYIGAPSLRVKSLKSVSTSGSRQIMYDKEGDVASERIVPSVIFTFTEADAAAVAELTARNVGKRFLIKLAGTPVVAPWLNEPIKGGSIELSLPRGEDKKLEEMLKALVSP